MTVAIGKIKSLAECSGILCFFLIKYRKRFTRPVIHNPRRAVSINNLACLFRRKVFIKSLDKIE